MKLNTNDFPRKLQHPMLLALLCFPFAWLLLYNLASAVTPWVYVIPAAYVLLAWACILVPGRRRIVLGLVSAGMLLGLGVVAAQRAGVGAVLTAVLYTVLIFVSLPVGSWPRERELNLSWYVTGILSHLLMQLLVDGSKRLGADVYRAAAQPLLASFMGYALLTVLALNRASMESASMSRRTVPLLMKRQNKVLTIGLLILGVLLAAIPAIGAALSRVWDWIVQLILIIGAFLSTIMPAASRGGAKGGGMAADDSMTMGAPGEPSALAVILEKILSVLALVTALALLGLFLWAVGRKLLRLFKLLWARWNAYSAAASEDYEDEVTSTRDESDVERAGLLKRLQRIVPEDEKGLTANERIRSRYKRLKRRRDWSSASTARENLAPDTAALYERVRYGGEALTDQDADRFREGTKRA